MESKLKPCPFCGCEDAKMQCVDSIYYIQCMGCNARATSVFEEEKDITIKSWNTRPKPSVKWPEKKPVTGQRIDVENDNKTWNEAIDVCQAAVEAAGLEYGLDEEKLAEFLFKSNKVQSELLQHRGGCEVLAKAIKLAERELITRTTP